MKNKKFHTFHKLLFTFFILLCIIPFVLIFCAFFLPSQYEETFLGEMKYKWEHLRNTDGKRIIIVGGSNVPFALKSEYLKQHFQEYEIVDFGMYADLGTVIMLDWAKSEIHEDDIFIVMPEQNEQTLSCHFSGESVWQATDGMMNMVSYLPFARYEKLLSSFPVFSGKKLYYTVTYSPKPAGIYARSSFNQYGDISYPERQYNIMPNGYNPNDIIYFEPSMLQQDFISEINAFAETVIEKGAYIYYHFPPMNQNALAENIVTSKIDSYYDYLQDQLIFPIIGNPHNCLMDSGWFYDTNFHLNDSGAFVFTQMLIEDLKVALQDTSPTEVADIAIPDIPTQVFISDNSCSDCFTYSKTDYGWCIDGLTQKGTVATSLLLPASYQGESIVEITSTLFHGNTNLKELTVQTPSILYDSMFQDCTSFQKLVLVSDNPSNYVVGENLLTGADFLIYVPKDAIDTYRRHYSWQQYSENLVANEQ